MHVDISASITISFAYLDSNMPQILNMLQIKPIRIEVKCKLIINKHKQNG